MWTTKHHHPYISLDLPHLVTILLALSIIWGKKMSLTYSLKCVVSFSGGISSSQVIHCRYVLGFIVLLRVSSINLNTVNTTVWHQSKIQWCNDSSFISRFLGSVVTNTAGNCHQNYLVLLQLKCLDLSLKISSNHMLEMPSQSLVSCWRLIFPVSHHNLPLHLPTWESASKHVRWMWYNTYCRNLQSSSVKLCTYAICTERLKQSTAEQEKNTFWPEGGFMMKIMLLLLYICKITPLSHIWRSLHCVHSLSFMTLV